MAPKIASEFYRAANCGRASKGSDRKSAHGNTGVPQFLGPDPLGAKARYVRKESLTVEQASGFHQLALGAAETEFPDHQQHGPGFSCGRHGVDGSVSHTPGTAYSDPMITRVVRMVRIALT